jgi:hypothetical protein
MDLFGTVGVMGSALIRLEVGVSINTPSEDMAL